MMLSLFFRPVRVLHAFQGSASCVTARRENDSTSAWFDAVPRDMPLPCVRHRYSARIHQNGSPDSTIFCLQIFLQGFYTLSQASPGLIMQENAPKTRWCQVRRTVPNECCCTAVEVSHDWEMADLLTKQKESCGMTLEHVAFCGLTDAPKANEHFPEDLRPVLIVASGLSHSLWLKSHRLGF